MLYDSIQILLNGTHETKLFEAYVDENAYIELVPLRSEALYIPHEV